MNKIPYHMLNKQNKIRSCKPFTYHRISQHTCRDYIVYVSDTMNISFPTRGFLSFDIACPPNARDIMFIEVSQLR